MMEKIYSLLKKSEKYTKTDMIYLFKGGFWLSLGQVSGALIAFILSIVLANTLTQEDYGTYKYLLSAMEIIGTLSLSGLGIAVTQSVASGNNGVLRLSFRENVKWSVGMVIAGIIGGSYYIYHSNNILGLSILVIGLLSPVLTSAELYGSFLSGKKDFKRSSLYWLYTNIIISILAITIASTSGSPLLMIVTYLVSNTICNLYFYFKTIKIYGVSGTEGDVLNYGKNLTLMNIISTVAQHIDKILIFQILGSAELAIYTFAVAIPEQIKGVLKIPIKLAFPKISENKNYVFNSNAKKKVEIFIISSIIITIVYIYLSPFIYQILFPKYLTSITYSQVASITIFTAISGFFVSILQAKMKKKQLYINTITTNGIQIISNFVFIYYAGIWGAVFSNLFNRIISFYIPYKMADKLEK